MNPMEIELNRKFAAIMQTKNGYAPNPLCAKCDGSGMLHPLNIWDNSVKWDELILCDAPGCLKESKRNG